MSNESKISALILVVETLEETRDGIEMLLHTDGYRVQSGRSVEDSILVARREPPNLILISLDGTTVELIAAAAKLRREAGLLQEEVPVVIFCVDEVPSGEEVGVGENIYITQLDNFNQLRAFMHQLLTQQGERPLTV